MNKTIKYNQVRTEVQICLQNFGQTGFKFGYTTNISRILTNQSNDDKYSIWRTENYGEAKEIYDKIVTDLKITPPSIDNILDGHILYVIVPVWYS